MSLLPAIPGEVVAASGTGLAAAVATLWRLGRKDCRDQIKALQDRVTALESRVTELTERLIAEARLSRPGD